ncbi:MAG TPA: DUF1501 domain-containing protein, partial [Pseudoxanthomonas sp.]|nr:DUF1501 domain-containing protein [Pseudoxanthomonas sp.]
AGSLLAAAAVSAQSAGDYKALVCIDLTGGNDQSNTVIPISNTGYASYQQGRPTLALPKNSILPLNPTGYTGDTLGLHPSLAPLKPLFDSGRIALLANVGPLAYPLTKAQLQAGTVPVPSQLESHSDQAQAWQSGLPDVPSSTGWMGRIGDVTASAFNPNSGVSIAMSIAGNNILQAGQDTIQYQLTTRGAVRVNGLDGLWGSQAGGTALRALMTGTRSHLLERELIATSARSLAAEEAVSAALASAAGNVTTVFPNTRIGQQLKMVARMISVRNALSQRRQLFFVSQGGYDHHDNLIDTDNRGHAHLLGDLAEAMVAFNSAMNALGIPQDVTTFTASEFGRALQHNGRGSDHGWGGHHFIMGGAVLGNRIYGSFPTVALGGPEDYRQGSLLPTTAVDQYAATLATWFGVSDSDMSTVLPNITRFSNLNLGFLG